MSKGTANSFYCISSEKYKSIDIYVPALKGRRLVGFGAGHIIAIDRNDKLSAVLVNPLISEGSTTLPRLREWCRESMTCGFATDPKSAGDRHVFVVIYRWSPNRQDNMVSMWRCGSDAGWVTIPFNKFRPAMPQLRRRLAEHGPGIMEEDLAAAADGENGGMDWPVGERHTYLIEHDGQVRLLFREDNWRPFPWLPGVSFSLQDVTGDDFALVDWADAPELHGKIILQSWHNPCYVLPESDHFTGFSSKNCVYFFSCQHLEEGKEAEYRLCKWDWVERVSTVVNKMPGVWDWALGRWFLPTLVKIL
jgi:hypothetical protein